MEPPGWRESALHAGFPYESRHCHFLSLVRNQVFQKNREDLRGSCLSKITMSDVVISAENLGKKYIIGHQNQQESYTALRDVVGRTIKGLARSAQDMMHGRAIVPGDSLEDFWALKDINFEIKRGDVVG